jgi:hypothetical protein
MILKNIDKILLPFFDSNDIENILEKIEKIDFENKQFILLRLLDIEHIKFLAKRMKKDADLLISELEDDGWNSLYYYEEEFKKKYVNVRIALKSGNVVNEILQCISNFGIDTIILTREQKKGFEGMMKEKILKNIMLDSDKIIIII